MNIWGGVSSRSFDGLGFPSMPAKIGVGKALPHGSTGPDFKTVEEEIG